MGMGALWDGRIVGAGASRVREHRGSGSIAGAGAPQVWEHRGSGSTAGAGAWRDGTQRHARQRCSAVWLWGLPQSRAGGGTATVAGL